MAVDCLPPIDMTFHNERELGIDYSDERISDVYTYQEELDNLGRRCYEAANEIISSLPAKSEEVANELFKIFNDFIVIDFAHFKPVNYSFSLTNEPSLHFFVRFHGKLSLFIEAFIDETEDGISVEVLNQIKKNGTSILEIKGELFETKKEILRILINNLDSIKKDTFFIDSW